MRGGRQRLLVPESTMSGKDSMELSSMSSAASSAASSLKSSAKVIDESEQLTLAQLRRKKQELFESAFDENIQEKMVTVRDESTGKKVKKAFSDVFGFAQLRPTHRGDENDTEHDDTLKLPGWLWAVIRKIRGTCFFKACIAREPETPLTVLHLMQPVAGFWVIVGMISTLFALLRVANVFDSQTATETQHFTAVAHILLFSVAGFILTYVGLKARDCPSQEKLHIELDTKVNDLGISANTEEGFADDAEGLANISLSWIAARREEKDKTEELRENVKRITEERQEFELKRQLLEYLMKGEVELAKLKVAKLERLLDRKNITGDDNITQKAEAQPNGVVDATELEMIINQIHRTENERTLYGGVCVCVCV
jgi:hypothetical protein